MLFNSYEFIFAFVPIVLVGFFLLSRHNRQLSAIWLVASSLFFYGWWNPNYVVLLLASVAFNFGIGYVISHVRGARQIASHTKWILFAAIAANLGLLGYFKYTNFLVENLGQLTETTINVDTIILPLGISFFTFTQIAFLVDTYRGEVVEYSFWHYLLFVTYFPHLIAGPVLHHKQMMPQFAVGSTYRVDPANLIVGLLIFSIGLGKKVLLADQFAVYASPVFQSVADGAQLGAAETWTGAIGYTLQLYFDFSGYSDMAIGLSLMFNISLPINFNSPYKAANIVDFWRRWHMTLSAFLRDYLYIPLGGNRLGEGRRYTNMFLTMVLGGVWHGANWTFILWGAMHGIYLTVNHLWRLLVKKLRLPHIPLARNLGCVLTFLAVVVAWVLFRSADIGAATKMLYSMGGLNGLGLPTSVFRGTFPITNASVVEVVGCFSIGLAIVWLFPNTYQLAQSLAMLDQGKKALRHANFIVGFTIGTLLTTCTLSFNHPTEFLYFQF